MAEPNEASLFQEIKAFHDAKRQVFTRMMTFDTFRLDRMKEKLDNVSDDLHEWRVGEKLKPSYHEALDQYNELCKVVNLPDLIEITAIKSTVGEKGVKVYGIYEHIEEVQSTRQVLSRLLETVAELRKNPMFKAAEECRLSLLQ